MLPARNLLAALVVLAAAGLCTRAAAQCQSYDFENLAVGTVVTTQYEGVTFSVVGQSCSNDPTIYVRIANQFLGDPFGGKVLLIDGGCPDFSSDYIRMVFDLPQREVSFTLGPWYGTYVIRAYATTSGGSPISTTYVTIPGDGFTGCHRFVPITSAAGNIRRIEIQETNGLWEAIDDLAFNFDDTPPTAEITSPAVMACVCGSVQVQGIACDEDGAYDEDRLEYLRVYPPGGATWTLVNSAQTPLCEPGVLYTWNTTPGEITEGLYVLRLTVTNACGLSSSAVTTVCVDKDFDDVTIRTPASGAILGGTVCLDGTAWDEFCFDSYVVQYKPASGGTWQPVDPAHLTYTLAVTHDLLANWSTAAVPDGNYYVRVVGETGCGHNASETIAVTLDNTLPIGRILQPAACSAVSGAVPIYGTASDAHLYHWRLDYYDPTARAWDWIADDDTPVTNGLLGTWNTAGLPACYYTVRLQVWDNSIVAVCSHPDRQYAEDYLSIAVGGVGCPGDVNGDGIVSFDDINPFVDLMGTVCP